MRLYLGVIFIFSLSASAVLASPENAAHAIKRGTMHFEQGAYSRAAASFRRSYREEPNWKILFNIALCESAAGKNQRAIKAFEKYLQVGGSRIDSKRRIKVQEAINRLQSYELAKEGNVLFENGDYEAAAKVFRQAYQMHPDPEFLYNIGHSEVATRHYESALKIFEQYLSLGENIINPSRRKLAEAELIRLKGQADVKATTLSRNEQLPAAGPPIDEQAADADYDFVNENDRRGMSDSTSNSAINNSAVNNSGNDNSGNDNISNSLSDSHYYSNSNLANTNVPRDNDIWEEEFAEMARMESWNNSDDASDLQSSNRNVAGPLLLTTGILSGITGGIIGMLSLSKGDKVRDGCSEACDEMYYDKIDEVGRLNLTADILFATAAVAGISGLIATIVHAKRKKKNETIAVMPTATPDGAGFMIERSF